MTVDFSLLFPIAVFNRGNNTTFSERHCFKNTALVYMNVYLVVHKSQCLSLTVHSPVRNTFQPPRSFGSGGSLFSSGSLGLGDEVQFGASDSYSVISSNMLDMAKHAVEFYCTCRPNRDVNS